MDDDEFYLREIVWMAVSLLIIVLVVIVAASAL